MYQLLENVNGTRPASNLLQIVTFEAQTLPPRNHLYPHKPFLGTDVYNTRFSKLCMMRSREPVSRLRSYVLEQPVANDWGAICYEATVVGSSCIGLSE